MRGEMSQYRIAEVAVTETDVELTLANGVRLAEPIRRYVRLEQAEPAQRQRWALTEDEHGVNWPGLVESTTSGVVTVWSLLQDRLYEAALDGLKQDAGRPEAGRLAAERLAARDRELVVLWRAEADIYNGGFMQFLCNWGEPNCRAAIAAYDALGASESARLARAMFAVVEHYGQSVEVVSLAGLPAILTDDEHEQLQTLDECCWTDPDGLARLVVEHYDTPSLSTTTRRT